MLREASTLSSLSARRVLKLLAFLARLQDITRNMVVS